MPSLLSIKTVIRCRDFDASRHFYASILNLTILEEWSEPQGRGAIFGFGSDCAGMIEIYEMTQADARFDPAFASPIANDKIDVQLKTDSVAEWADCLRDVWTFVGPEELPWRQRWIKLRDPDGLLVAFYEDRA
jgi:catechol 2,3-dioxygenase-like lactoylglutathione lyase family enzyme